MATPYSHLRAQMSPAAQAQAAAQATALLAAMPPAPDDKGEPQATPDNPPEPDDTFCA